MDAKTRAKLRQRKARAAGKLAQAEYAPIPGVQRPESLTVGQDLPGSDIVRSYLQGGMLNTSDEALAFAKSKLGMGEYENLLDIERMRLERIPMSTRLPAEMTGAAMTLAATAPALAKTGVGGAVSRMPSMARLPLVGGLEGAAAGFGAGEGGLMNRAASAGLGAGLGGLMGLAIPMITAPMRAGFRAAATSPRLGAAASSPVEKRTKEAMTNIAEAMTRDDQSAQQLVNRAGRLPQDAPVVAAGQENLQGLLRAVSQKPGRAKSMTERTMQRVGRGQLPRLYKLTSRVTGGRDYGDTIDEVVKRRKARAAPLYQQAFRNDPVLDDPRLNELADVDAIQKALATARRRVSEPLEEGGAVVRLADLPENSIQVWDQVYKQLGSAEHGARSAVKPNVDKARQMGILRRRLRDVMTDISPSYRQALNVFSEETSLKDAMELGSTILRPGSEATPKAIKSLPEPEKQMFVVGVGKAIEDKLAGVSDLTQMRNAVEGIFSNKRTRDRLAAGLPSLKAYQEFKKGILQEQVLLKTRRSTSPSVGSQTIPRLLEEGDAQSPTSLHSLIQDMRTWNVFGPLAAARSRGARVLEGMGNKMKAGLGGSYDETARLLNQPASEASNLMGAIGKQMTDEEIYRLMQLGLLGAGTTAGTREGSEAAGTLLMP